MRVYLPTTLPLLRAALEAGEFPVPSTAFAVTPGLRESYVSGDQEELEYAALCLAAHASLRLLDLDPEAPRRRVVVALEVSDVAVEVADAVEPGAVRLHGAVWRDVQSAHVDDAAAEEAVAAAAAAVIEADLGSEDAEFTVGEAEGHELLWFATQEIPLLVL